jgi:hypothetical protein
MKKKMKKGIYIECLKCGHKIHYDTDKKMTYCKCQAIAVDGCEFYCRVKGDAENYKIIHIDGRGRIRDTKVASSK